MCIVELASTEEGNVKFEFVSVSETFASEGFWSTSLRRLGPISIGNSSGTRLVEQEFRRGGFRVTMSQARELIAKLKSVKEGRSKTKLRELVKVKRALDQERSRVGEGDVLRLLAIVNRHSLQS